MSAPNSRPGKSLSPVEKAISAFPDEFLKCLGERFAFDASDPQIVESVRHIAEGYFIVRRRPKSADDRRKIRREYRQLLARSRNFLEILKNARKTGIDEGMDFFAGLNIRDPKFGKTAISSINAGVAKFDVLLGLLNLLATTTEREIEILAMRRGPKVNEALEITVRRAMDFWTFQLGRKLTVDHHEGTGTTQSFEFLRTLMNRLDRNISDTKIVTALRADRAVRKRIETLSEKAGKSARMAQDRLVRR